MTRRRGTATMVLAAVMAITAVGCVPDPGPQPTRLDITTQLTWCGGVIPPPGEPWCHTSVTSTDVEVLQRRTVVASGTTGSDGRLLVEVPVGTFMVAAVDPPTYMECDTPLVTSVAGRDTPVLQTCTVMAP